MFDQYVCSIKYDFKHNTNLNCTANQSECPTLNINSDHKVIFLMNFHNIANLNSAAWKIAKFCLQEMTHDNKRQPACLQGLYYLCGSSPELIPGLKNTSQLRVLFLCFLSTRWRVRAGVAMDTNNMTQPVFQFQKVMGAGI